MAKMSIPILVDWESIKDHLAKSDIVEVIRCKDCRYSYEGCTKYVCERTFHEFTVEPDGYCAWAKRKQDDSHE